MFIISICRAITRAGADSSVRAPSEVTLRSNIPAGSAGTSIVEGSELEGKRDECELESASPEASKASVGLELVDASRTEGTADGMEGLVERGRGEGAMILRVLRGPAAAARARTTEAVEICRRINRTDTGVANIRMCGDVTIDKMI